MPTLRLGDRRLDGDLLIFDKDGVLLDFHHLWGALTQARARRLCSAVERPEADPALLRLLGLGPDGRALPGGLLAGGTREEAITVAAGWLHLQGLAWAAARQAAREAFAQAEEAVDFAACCRCLPGTPEAIARLHAAGWRLAIATTDRSEGAWRFLRQSGLDAYFSAVVGAERVERSKPDPAMVELACREAKSAPGRAVMIGDLDLDLQMGREAGALATIGVLSGVGEAVSLAPVADAVFADVTAFVNSCLG